jgi:hypothetical protein
MTAFRLLALAAKLYCLGSDYFLTVRGREDVRMPGRDVQLNSPTCREIRHLRGSTILYYPNSVYDGQESYDDTAVAICTRVC